MHVLKFPNSEVEKGGIEPRSGLNSETVENTVTVATIIEPWTVSVIKDRNNNSIIAPTRVIFWWQDILKHNKNVCICLNNSWITCSYALFSYG